MSEIAHEARLIWDEVNLRIHYHSYQQDRWAKEEKQHDENGEDSHYARTRKMEHLYALSELYQIKEIVDRIRRDAAIRVKFETRGYQDGRSAGSVAVEVGVTDARRVLKGIEDGDPEILNMIPQRDFSGEWADSQSWADLYIELTEIDPQDFDDEASQGMLDVYQLHYQRGAQDEIVQMLTGYSVKA